MDNAHRKSDAFLSPPSTTRTVPHSVRPCLATKHQVFQAVEKDIYPRESSDLKCFYHMLAQRFPFVLEKNVVSPAVKKAELGDEYHATLPLTSYARCSC